MGYQEENNEQQNQVQEPDMSGTYTARDYLSWQFEGLVELIRGKIFKMSPSPLPPHHIVSANLLRELYQIFPKNAKCKVLDAPADLFLVKPGEDYRDTHSVVQPDIMIVCDPSRITPKAVLSPVNLVVEILSPGNSRRDLKNKLELYEEYQIPEYWIVDPQNKTVLVYILEGKLYQPQKPRVPGDRLTSPYFKGVEIEVVEIFTNLPGEEN